MIYGCIAKKLGHSFSKDIHERLFDYEYELKELAPDELDAFMRKKDFKGINVTIPYKEAVIPYLDFMSPTALSIGAVNTIVNDGGTLRGYNTDFSGMSALITKNGISLKDKKVVILGSGGTSKTALAVAKSMDCREVIRASRGGREDCITYEALTGHRDAEIIINTTPVGMYPEIGAAPIDINDFPCAEAVIDAVYNPLSSRLVCDAKGKGITAAGGLYMLVAQAAYAAEKFTGTRVAPTEIGRVYNELVFVKKNIVLTGMPGCGKTTAGRLLAERTGKRFIDTDEEIVKSEGKAIPEIFSAVGEEGFREIEARIIKEVSKIQNAVIATGGGAILREENVRLLRENGRIYFIDRDIGKIEATSDRPLSSDRAALEKRYEERYPLYTKRCDVKIKADGSPEEAAEMIKEDFYNENTCN